MVEYFSQGRGINIVSPDSIDPHRSPAPLLITGMAINDEPVVPASLIKESGSLRLSHKQDVLEFEFAAIDIDARSLSSTGISSKASRRIG